MDQGEKNKLLESFKSEVTETEDTKETSVAFVLIGLAIAVVVAVVVLFAFNSSKNNQLSALDQQIQNDVTVPLKNLAGEKKQTDSILDQISVLTTVLNKKLTLSQMLIDLSNNQYKLSRWSSLSYSQDKVTITAVADNFEDVLKTYNALKATKSVKSAKLVSTNINENTKKIEFTMEFSVNTDLYKVVPKTAATATTTTTATPVAAISPAVSVTTTVTAVAATTSSPSTDILNQLNNGQ